MVQAALYGGLAGLQLAGGYFASQNIKETAKLNKKISDMNAQFAELDSYDALNEGHTEATRYQSVVDNTTAEQAAQLAAQDVDVNYGSAASIQAETHFTGEMNKMEIEKHAQEQALGFRRQARDYRTSGAMAFADAKTKSGQAMFSGITSAAQTGLTGYERSK
jgi:hypothetical protein